MNPLDKLKADVVRQHERIEQLEKDAKDCQEALDAAHSAWVRARLCRLNRVARPPKVTEKELGELKEAIESCRAAEVSRQEALQAANTSVEQAKDWLTEMRQAWLPVFGPFPTRDT